MSDTFVYQLTIQQIESYEFSKIFQGDIKEEMGRRALRQLYHTLAEVGPIPMSLTIVYEWDRTRPPWDRNLHPDYWNRQLTMRVFIITETEVETFGKPYKVVEKNN